MSIQNFYIRIPCCIVSSKAMKTPFANCKWHYPQTSNISHTLVSNEIVDHPDVVEARRRCSNYFFILDLTTGFNGLGKDNFKTRRETFKLLGFGVSDIRGLTVWPLLSHIEQRCIKPNTFINPLCVNTVLSFNNAQLKDGHKRVHLTLSYECACVRLAKLVGSNVDLFLTSWVSATG